MVKNGQNGLKWEKMGKMVKHGGPDLKRARRTGLSARRAGRMKLRGLKGLQLEVRPRRGPCTSSMYNIYKCTQIQCLYIHTHLFSSTLTVYMYMYIRADAVYHSQWGHGVGGGPTSQLTRKITFRNWCHQACKIPEKIQIQLQIHIQIHRHI